jgi:hypothetical protein
MEGLIQFTKLHMKKKEWQPRNEMKKSIQNVLDQFSINDTSVKIELEMLNQIGKKYYDFFLFHFMFNNISQSFEFLTEKYVEKEFIDLIFYEFFQETDLLQQFPKEMMSEHLYSNLKQKSMFMFIGILVNENVSYEFLNRLFRRNKHVIENYVKFVFVDVKYKKLLDDYFETNYLLKPKYSSVCLSNVYDVKIYHFDNRIIGESSSSKEVNAFEIAAKIACKNLQLI